jgi:phosphopantetheinyl transferase
VIVARAAQAKLAEPHLDSADREWITEYRSDARPVVAAVHGAARWALGQVLGRQVFFERDPLGRPHVPTASAETAVDFSIAHAGDVGLVGVVSAGRIGVDVEAYDNHAAADVDAVCRHFLPLAAGRRVRSASLSTRSLVFLQEWTRFEAGYKCRARPYYAAARREEGEVDGFDHRFFEPVTGYVAAVVATSPLSDVVLVNAF